MNCPGFDGGLRGVLATSLVKGVLDCASWRNEVVGDDVNIHLPQQVRPIACSRAKLNNRRATAQDGK